MASLRQIAELVQQTISGCSRHRKNDRGRQISTATFTAVIPDGSVNEEALKALLAEQAEAPNLEYKQLRDLDQTEDVVKLARDVAAMQSQGGYIVIGVDGRGVATRTLNSRHVQLFDEATVRNTLKKYIAAPLDLRVACHPVSGGHVALRLDAFIPRPWPV